MKILDYKIMWSNDSGTDLFKKMVPYLEKGYQLQGGMSAEYQSGHHKGSWYCFQAIVKYDTSALQEGDNALIDFIENKDES